MIHLPYMIGFREAVRVPETLEMPRQTSAQGYPRIDEPGSRFQGFLDDTKLVQHENKISKEDLKKIIRNSIRWANQKSSREILEIPDDASEEVRALIYGKKGKELFDYFKKYFSDPAATAIACVGKHYSEVAADQFRNRALQKERMNSGWLYQFIAKQCAEASDRFSSVADIGSKEADFVAAVQFIDKPETRLNIYVSVKNRTNTMGGQDWPKAIHAMEAVASNDKNRVGPYVCIFGIAMDKGLRNIKAPRNSPAPYSSNTEVWKADYFWPFFSNYSFPEIIKTVTEVLGEKDMGHLQPELPAEVTTAFGAECIKNGLLDEGGKFSDAEKLVNLFCGL